jgi:hypothetical protein
VLSTEQGQNLFGNLNEIEENSPNMTTKFFPPGISIAIACLAAIGIARVGFAEPSAPPVPNPKMDTNKDGVVSESEYVAYAVALAKAEFKQLDRDGNGSLNAAELGAKAAASPVQKAEGLQRVFTGSDGQRAEFQKRISAGPSMRQGGR